jgi:Domain of unknown function DUF302
MVAAPLAALDLPLKVLVWADGSQTKVSYSAPGALAARYNLTDNLMGVDHLLLSISEAGQAEPPAGEHRSQPGPRALPLDRAPAGR